MGLFTQGKDYVEYRNAGETVRVMIWGKNSLRVVCVPNGPLDMSSSALLPPEETEAKIAIGEDTAEITNGKITAVFDAKDRTGAAVLSFYNDRKELLLKEIDKGGALVRRARYFNPYAGGDYRLKVTFESNPEEKLYGMGQYQQEVFNLKGCNLELAQRNSQASVPFYVSSLGYGFFWHNPAVGNVFFGKNTTEWRADSTTKMDYWITAGDSIAQIEDQYSTATGKAPMMPEFGLGFWQCKLRYHNQEQVLKVAREYHERNIPVDVFVIDYYHWPRCGDYRFDENYFPDPKAMVDELRSYGMEVMASIWPAVDWRSENFEEMQQKGLLVKTDHGMNLQMSFQGNNVFYDATNPEAREYVWEKCKKNYYDYGIKTFWLDVAEPEYGTFDYGNYRYYAGSVLQQGNIYPKEYARGFYEGQTASGQKDIVNLIRCAWAGSQRYGTLVWSGDISSNYESFRKQIVAGLQMGLSGIPWWTTDIGGFYDGNIYDEDFRELLVRWFQFGTFCPVMRLHGNRLPREPLYRPDGEETEGTGADNEIWSFGEENYQILKKFIEIREMLRDYTRGLMKEAHETGAPVMRAMFYEFPEDAVTWELNSQYMYGSDILVAPIVEEHAVSRKVYLPKGSTWTHAGTGEVYEGGQWVEVKAEIDTLPIFLQDGKQSYLIGKI